VLTDVPVPLLLRARKLEPKYELREPNGIAVIEHNGGSGLAFELFVYDSYGALIVPEAESL
jgi:hypothetical protein